MRRTDVRVGTLAVLLGIGISFLIDSPTSDFVATQENAAAIVNVDSLGPPVRWKLASVVSGNLVLVGTLGKRVEERIRVLSEGNMELKFFDPGALVPALEIFDAVSVGSVNAGWTSSGYWAGKVPALQFFAAVPFGPGVGEALAWMYYGGGLEMMQEIYRPYNIFSQPCTMTSPEGSGWFRSEIQTVEDLRGLKMRFFGLGAKVMEKIGASTQLIAGGDIFPALELGTIDAAEFAMPAIDLDLGFYEVAKHYYFPGWHQPTSFVELMINLDDWNSLTTRQQEIINVVCRENLLEGLAQGEAIQFPALQTLQEKGVILHRWSPEIIAVLKQAWEEVVQEEAAKNEDFARVWDSLRKFREEYKLWGDYGYLD